MVENPNVENLLVVFMNNNFKRLNRTKSKLINHIKISRHFPKPYSLYRDIKAEVDLFNYATKSDVKEIKDVDISSFGIKRFS